jgi:DNA-binding MarR family transcriptional regulator
LSINVTRESGESARRAEALTNELFDLSIALDLVGAAAASRIGINQTDLICLNLLVRHGPMSPGQVATTLGLTTAAISAMATRLEAGGYARREIDPKDRRRILMHASPDAAQRAFSHFDGFYHAVFELFGSYSEREQKLLLDLLARYRQILVDQAAAIKAG